MNSRLRYHPSVADDLTIIAELIANYASPEISKQKLNEIDAAARGLIDLSDWHPPRSYSSWPARHSRRRTLSDRVHSG